MTLLICSIYHRSEYGLISISYVKLVLGWVCKCQYASAICRSQGKKLVQQVSQLTASGLIFPSGCSTCQSLVRGISMIPSMILWATWTPCGPNSLAKLWLKARAAHFPAAKEPNCADPFMDAVAPVKISVGGWLSPEAVPLYANSRGSTWWANRNVPRLVSSAHTQYRM